MSSEDCSRELYPPLRRADAEAFAARAAIASALRVEGRIVRLGERQALATGLGGFVGLGDLCRIQGPREVIAEVVAADPGGVRLAAYGELAGFGRDARVVFDGADGTLRPHAAWLGRVVDAFGRPRDGGPPLQPGPSPRDPRAAPPPAHLRAPLGPRLATGVRVLDLFVPCCRGQRLGIFAGSGVGKSSLLSMIARGARADVVVVALVGERGRELGEFVRHTLGPEGLARSVVVCATSDEPAAVRRRAALAAMAVAEHFRDLGLHVLLLFDSVTRYAQALREIALEAGELPVSRGYPPAVFADLPRLLERAGPGTGPGAISAFFSVLVEGDDLDEPIADTVRGILDGHVVLSRRIAERGRFPAVDVPASLSRTAPGCYTDGEWRLVLRARRLLALLEETAELVELGAYRPGTNPELDLALRLRPRLEALMAQDVAEAPSRTDPWAELADILGEAPA